MHRAASSWVQWDVMPQVRRPCWGACYCFPAMPLLPTNIATVRFAPQVTRIAAKHLPPNKVIGFGIARQRLVPQAANDPVPKLRLKTHECNVRLRVHETGFQRGASKSSRHAPIDGTVGDTWLAIDKPLAAGRRGLPGGSSLARLLDERRPGWTGGRAR